MQLDFNQQTSEALKHIYTTMQGNPNIQITIDLPPKEEDPLNVDIGSNHEE